MAPDQTAAVPAAAPPAVTSAIGKITLDALSPKTLRELATSKMYVNLDVDRTQALATAARRLNRTWVVSGFAGYVYQSKDWNAGLRLTGRW